MPGPGIIVGCETDRASTLVNLNEQPTFNEQLIVTRALRKRSG